MIKWPWRSAEARAPRGITVYTIVSAELYPAGDAWAIDDKESAHVYDVAGEAIATFLHGSWLRIEAGAPPAEPVITPLEAPE